MRRRKRARSSCLLLWTRFPLPLSCSQRFPLRLQCRFWLWLGCRFCGLRWRLWRHLIFGETRQQVVAGSELIDAPRDLDGILLYIVFEDAFISVQVCVPGV